MMKKLYTGLKVAIWVVVGLFVAASAYQCYDYLMHPEIYDYTSIPWYYGIFFFAVPAVLIILVLLIVMWIVKRKMK